MYSGAQNPETWGGRPRKFDPRTQPNPEKQTLNHPWHQPILNFTLKIPETKPWKPEADISKMLILNPTRPRILLPDYITK